MKTFLKKYWAIIVLIIILLIISVLSFVPDKYLLSNDNYSPELNPGLTILRSLISPAWRSYRVLGFASDSEQADIFRTGLMGLFGLAAPTSSVAQGFSLVCLWTGVLSMAFLTRAITRDFVKTKYSNVIFLLAGIIYMTTLWTAWVFNFNMMPYITQFGFLPLLLLSVYSLFSDWSSKKLLLVFLCSILFTATSVIATLFIVDIVVICFFAILFGYLFKTKFKRIAFAIGIFLVTQLFWIFPFIHYTASTSTDIIDSATNRSITASTIDLEKQMMTLENSVRFYTRLLGTVDDPVQTTYLFPPSNDYIDYDFFKVLAYIPLFFSLLGLIFAIVKKKYSLLPLWLALLVFIFLLKNQNAPFGGIYVWLQDHFDIFKQIFRWVSSKLCQPYLIVSTITVSIGFLYFVDYLGSFLKGKWKHLPAIVFGVLVVAGLLGYSEYLFRGNLFAKRATVSFPAVYQELATYLESDTQGRIYYAPPSNNGYFREYDWGFIGSQFLGYILPNPLMDMSLAIGSASGEKGMLELTNDFESGNSDDFTKELQKYDVKYVLVDRSLVKGRYGHDLNWAVLDSYVKGWDLVWQKDFLELYTITSPENPTYTESLGTSEGTFIREVTKTPVLDVFDMNVGELSIDSGYIVRDITYLGNSQFLSFDPSKINQNLLPTTIRIENTGISTSPALPIVADVSLRSKKTFDIPKTFDYVVASDFVFSESDIAQGITLDTPWGFLNTIDTVKSETFVKKDMVFALGESKPGNCAGDKFKLVTDVVPEILASGFSIQGKSELPCVSTGIKLLSNTHSVGILHINWEVQSGSMMGICLFSNNEKKCLNDKKYFSTTAGFGNEDILIPKLISGNDDISLSIYALNPSGAEAKIMVREISLSLSNTLETYSVSSERLEQGILTTSVMNGDNLSIKIPIIYGDNSTIYLGEEDSNIWHPNTAKDPLKEYSVTSGSGMIQKVQGQYLNQYENILHTEPNQKYLWVWEGRNISNIPATLCLTYQGDDKCWIDDTFYDGQQAVVSKLFTTSPQYTKMDESYKSTSYDSVSENILKNAIVMRVPSQWLGFELSSTSNIEYSVVEAKVLGNPSASTVYSLKYNESFDKNTLLTIPQSQSNGWVAVTNTGVILDNRVTVNGWKQGWDISNTDFNTIYIFYWPNLLGYIGYILIVVEFTYLVIKVFRKRKYARQ